MEHELEWEESKRPKTPVVIAGPSRRNGRENRSYGTKGKGKQVENGGSHDREVELVGDSSNGKPLNQLDHLHRIRNKKSANNMPYLPGRNSLESDSTPRGRSVRQIHQGERSYGQSSASSSRITLPPTSKWTDINRSRGSLKGAIDTTHPSRPLSPSRVHRQFDPPRSLNNDDEVMEVDGSASRYQLREIRHPSTDLHYAPNNGRNHQDSSSFSRTSTSPVHFSSPPVPIVRPTPLKPRTYHTPHHGRRRQIGSSHDNKESGDAHQPYSIDSDDDEEEFEKVERNINTQRHLTQTAMERSGSGSAKRQHRGIFGSHGKKMQSNDNHETRGRAIGGSASPKKAEARPFPMPFPVAQHVEEEDESEEQEPIESPDGPYASEGKDDNDFEMLPARTKKKDVAAQSGGDKPVTWMSGRDPTINRVGPLRAMKPKEQAISKSTTVPLSPSASRRPPGAIQSSNLNGRFVAEVDVAWLPEVSEVLNVKICSIEGNALVMTNIGGRRGISLPLSRVPLNKLSNARICIGPNHPIFIANLNLKGHNLFDAREQLGNMTNGLDPRQLQDFQMIVAFYPNSQEGCDFTGHIAGLLKQEGIQVSSIDDVSAVAIRSGYEEIIHHKRDTRAQAREKKLRRQTIDKDLSPADQAAKAATGRANPPVNGRTRSDSFGSEDAARNGPYKGKAKAKDIDPTQSKLSFMAEKKDQSVVTRKSKRISSAQNAYTEIDSEGEGVKQPIDYRPIVPELPPAEKGEMLFSFPLHGKAEINISKGDRHRIKTNDFLNDTIIEFGLKHVASRLRQDVRDKVHLFSSFFYDKIADKKLKATSEGWPAYDTVKKWTKNKNIFEKEFVVVPINESYHWYFAVIYNPGAILRERPPDEEGPPNPHATRARVSGGKRDLSNDDLIHDDSTLHQRESKSTDVDELTSDRGDGATEDGQDGNIRTSHTFAGDMSIDELDVLAQPEGQGLEDVRNKTSNLTIGGEDDSELVRDSSPDAPIQTPEMMMYAQQSQALGQSHEVPASPPKVFPKQDAKPDLRIWGSDQCWIFTFDSLGGGHRAVHTVLNRWLHYEARDKGAMKGHDRPSDAQYSEAKVPQQPNFSDCGLYLIHYAEQLLNRPQETIQFIQRAPPRIGSAARAAYNEDIKEVWHDAATGNLRQAMLDVVDGLADEYRKSHKVGNAEQGDTAGDFPMEASQDSIAVINKSVLMPGAFPTGNLNEIPEGDDPAAGPARASEEPRQPSVDPGLTELSALDVAAVDKDFTPAKSPTIDLRTIAVETQDDDETSNSDTRDEDDGPSTVPDETQTIKITPLPTHIVPSFTYPQSTEEPRTTHTSSQETYDPDWIRPLGSDVDIIDRIIPFTRVVQATQPPSSPFDDLAHVLDRAPPIIRPASASSLTVRNSLHTFFPTAAEVPVVSSPQFTGFSQDFLQTQREVAFPTLEEVRGTTQNDASAVDPQIEDIDIETRKEKQMEDVRPSDIGEVRQDESGSHSVTNPDPPTDTGDSDHPHELSSQAMGESSTSQMRSSPSPADPFTSTTRHRGGSPKTYISQSKKGRKPLAKKRDLDSAPSGSPPKSKKPRQSLPTSKTQATLSLTGNGQLRRGDKMRNDTAQQTGEDKGRKMDDPIELDTSSDEGGG